MALAKLQVELVLVMVLAMMCSIPITPSLAQEDGPPPCWKSIFGCIDDHFNRSSEPQFNTSSPLFDVKETLCCPLIQQEAQTEKQCFCLVDNFIHANPTDSFSGNLTALLKLCEVATDLTALDAFCLDMNSSPAAAPMPTSLGGAGASSLSSFTFGTEAAVTQRTSKPASPPSTIKSGVAKTISFTASLAIFVVLSTAFLFY